MEKKALTLFVAVALAAGAAIFAPGIARPATGTKKPPGDCSILRFQGVEAR